MLRPAALFASVWCALGVEAAENPLPPFLEKARRLAPGPGQRTPQQQRDADIGSCIFDTLHAGTYIAQAGTAIDSSTRRCAKQCALGTHSCGEQAKALCAVSITEIIQSFLFAGSFLGFAANECPEDSVAKGTNYPENCGGAILAMVAGIADVAQAGAALSYDCPKGKNYPGRRLDTEEARQAYQFNATDKDHYWEEVKPDVSEDMKTLMETNKSLTEMFKDAEERRLWSPPRNPYWQNPVWSHSNRPPPGNQLPQERNFHEQVAFCSIYAAQGAWYLARAGMEINLITNDCKNLFNGGLLAGFTQDEKARCIGTFANMITAILYVASYVSGAAAQCAHGVNMMAGCIADMTKLLAALGVVATQGSRMYNKCEQSRRRLEEMLTTGVYNDTLLI